MALRVVAPAHLHAGNPDLAGDLGRLYGTAGFVIDRPHTVLVLTRAGRRRVTGPRAEDVVRWLDLLAPGDPLEVHIEEVVPQGVGLGSTTSLVCGLLVGLGRVGVLARRPDTAHGELLEAAARCGRGRWTGFGVHGALFGGSFLIDGGFRIDPVTRVRVDARIPPLVFRGTVPASWRFVVALPHAPVAQVAAIKAREEDVLAQVPKMAEATADRLSRLLLMQACPALVEGDLTTFGAALTAFNRRLGGFWQDFQEGDYCHGSVAEVLRVMYHAGAAGVAQSCWGPTCYGVFPSEARARQAVDDVRRCLDTWGGGDLWVATPHAAGVVVEPADSPGARRCRADATRGPV
ncbi:MAG: hypothetical protein K6W08_06655 [Firmicutes bacterium]|nr:hypothetical protein [Bacillota bacterium]